MPNFALLCPIILYLPAIIIASVASITAVIHGVINWMGRRPAMLVGTEDEMRIRDRDQKVRLPDSPYCDIDRAISVRSFSKLERA